MYWYEGVLVKECKETRQDKVYVYKGEVRAQVVEEERTTHPSVHPLYKAKSHRGASSASRHWHHAIVPLPPNPSSPHRPRAQSIIAHPIKSKRAGKRDGVRRRSWSLKGRPICRVESAADGEEKKSLGPAGPIMGSRRQTSGESWFGDDWRWWNSNSRASSTISSVVMMLSLRSQDIVSSYGAQAATNNSSVTPWREAVANATSSVSEIGSFDTFSNGQARTVRRPVFSLIWAEKGGMMEKRVHRNVRCAMRSRRAEGSGVCALRSVFRRLIYWG